ncbi:phospholipid-binding lipoprotein MlaA [Desulfacinum hydrothermale DSM 13146]|uniref:Phospholipid-binding lipoprotein MlaA n=1 Tax=Desulfacinum hydrothermale DSM 13146 TaxID=1121390 RepID=A0A1W1XUS0_9BACT|nr:VacJ family lipoprotein [Desulfacinum hydrothermale]SMC27730.1 phospholipid-binding lipoprotein MlaA [Desulfacinum hydrothermale DSM 13146]
MRKDIHGTKIRGAALWLMGAVLAAILAIPWVPGVGATDAWAATDEFHDPFAEETVTVADPLEPMNRFFFHFNDKLYFWVLKPVAKVYGTILPPGVRIAIRNAYDNILAPVRIVNNLLQGKIKRCGVEIARFALNSTLGAGGMFDPAEQEFGLKAYDEDFGQTLGVYGMGHGIYINWPLFGPSSIRDTLGFGGDIFLDPTSYLYPPAGVYVGVKAVKVVNRTSLRLGEYEDLKASALDPYVALRDAYISYRHKQVQE